MFKGGLKYSIEKKATYAKKQIVNIYIDQQEKVGNKREIELFGSVPFIFLADWI